MRMQKMNRSIIAALTAAAVLTSGLAGCSSSGRSADDNTADVIIVGAGAGGLAAAAGAGESGATVIVLEANYAIGGSCARSGGNIAMTDNDREKAANTDDYNGRSGTTPASVNPILPWDPAGIRDMESYLAITPGVTTNTQQTPMGPAVLPFDGKWGSLLAALKQQINDYQKSPDYRKKIFDSPARIEIFQYINGMGRDLSDKWFTLDYDLITKALDANEDIYDWLAGGGGMTIKAYNSRWGLTSPFRPGTIVNKNDEDNPYDIQYSYGPGLIAALKQLSDAANLAHSGPDYIRLETRGIGLIMENGKVTGVKAMGPDGKALTFYARKGVVLATGSYAGNDAMVRQYQNMYTQEQLAQLPVKTDNPPTNVGDGIIMAQKLGAQLRDMEFVSGNANNGWHLTYGGLVINPYAQVLDTNNVAIPGLYACGDVTSGFEGYNHQTGTCLTGVIYYGRLAGKELAVSKNIDKL